MANPLTDEIWGDTAERIASHVRGGREHLMTEETLRFALIASLQEAGVSPSDMDINEQLSDRQGWQTDLAVGNPRIAAVEAKYPGGPRRQHPARTRDYGNVLADVYRLAVLNVAHRWAAVLAPRTFQTHAKNQPLPWSFNVGGDVHVSPDRVRALAKTARRELPGDLVGEMHITARCRFSRSVGQDLRLVAYEIGETMTVASTGPDPDT